MVKFVLKNNFFVFFSKRKQISGTAIDTPYASIFMDQVKNFLGKEKNEFVTDLYCKATDCLQ